MTTTTLSLRPYQAQAQRAIEDTFLSGAGANRQLVVIPTAGGKTVIFATVQQTRERLRGWFESFPPDQRKILVIAHREELLAQAKAKFEQYNTGVKVAIEQADAWAPDDADVVVASIQTLASRQGRRLMRFKPTQFRLVIVDEAHHATAPTYIDVLQYFKLLPPDDFMPTPFGASKEAALDWQRERLAAFDAQGRPPRLLLGVTATPNRADLVGLEAVFQSIVFETSMLDLMRQGFLSPLRAFRIRSKTNLDNVKTKRTDEGTDFDQVALAKAIDDVHRYQLIVKAWLEHAQGVSTIVFMPSVASAQAQAEAFRAAGRRFEAVWGQDPDRARKLRQHAARALEGLVNVDVLTEGYDDPGVECIVHGAPTKSAAKYTQRTGRGTRLANGQHGSPDLGKTHCLILDVVDVTRKHSLITAPTLIGLPAEYDAQGRDLMQERSAVDAVKAANPLVNLEHATSLEHVEALAEEVNLFETFTLPELPTPAMLRWMKMGENQYQLYYNNHRKLAERLCVEPNQWGSWRVYVDQFGTKADVHVPCATLDQAIAAGEQFMRDHRTQAVEVLRRDAPWRAQPQTDAQRQSLPIALGSTGLLNKIDTRTLNCGETADLLRWCWAQ